MPFPDHNIGDDRSDTQIGCCGNPALNARNDGPACISSRRAGRCRQANNAAQRLEANSYPRKDPRIGKGYTGNYRNAHCTAPERFLSKSPLMRVCWLATTLPASFGSLTPSMWIFVVWLMLTSGFMKRSRSASRREVKSGT